MSWDWIINQTCEIEVSWNLQVACCDNYAALLARIQDILEVFFENSIFLNV